MMPPWASSARARRMFGGAFRPANSTVPASRNPIAIGLLTNFLSVHMAWMRGATPGSGMVT
jgi:hypothetical protein